MTQLLEKMAVESVIPAISGPAADSLISEAFLINLKTINARYDKLEAVAHIKMLMEKYNIQIDELFETIKY
jgi:hypothetical protein